jgi:hypothetical protein
VADREQDAVIKKWVEQQLVTDSDKSGVLPDLVADDDLPSLDVNVRSPPNFCLPHHTTSHAQRLAFDTVVELLQIVTTEMLDELSRLGQGLNRRGHPSLSALISLVTFTHSWLNLQRYVFRIALTWCPSLC